MVRKIDADAEKQKKVAKGKDKKPVANSRNLQPKKPARVAASRSQKPQNSINRQLQQKRGSKYAQQKPRGTTGLKTSANNSNTLKPLEEVRTANVNKGSNTTAMSMLGFYLGGISGGFTPGDIPEMKRDPDVSVGLEYLLTPILNAKITIEGMGEEQMKAQEIFDRFWQHDLECFKDMFSYGYCPAEVKYKQAEEVAVAGNGMGAVAGMPQDGEDEDSEDSGNDENSEEQATKTREMSLNTNRINSSIPTAEPKLEYDGMIPLEPSQCEPWVHEGRLAYIRAFGKVKLEGHTDKRPAKGFWLANDPTYSPYMGNSVLPGAWLFWRAKIGMPDSAVEVLLKANYKCAFSGLQVRYPSEDISDDDGIIYDARAEAEWFAENIKAGTNVVLPSETDDQGKPKWDITSYGGQPIDISKMLPLMDWLTKQIHRGIGVVDDVITKEGNVGSYSRANVSRQMFLMLALRRARRIAHTFDQMVCRPLMKRNGYAATYKIDVKIPGMEDDDPNQLGTGGGQGGPDQGEDGQPGGEGEEGGPLAKLFQRAMDGGDEENGAEQTGAGGGNGKGKGAKSPGKEMNMSLASFLGNWRESANAINMSVVGASGAWDESKHPRVASGDHGGEFAKKSAVINKSKEQTMASKVSPKQTYYHGTNVNFKKFDADKGNGWMSFSPQEWHASNFGDKVVEVKLDVKNPIDLTDFDTETDAVVSGEKLHKRLAEIGFVLDASHFKGEAESINNYLTPLRSEIKKQAMALGFDGIIRNDYKYEQTAEEVVVFDPSQIKLQKPKVNPGKQKTREAVNAIEGWSDLPPNKRSGVEMMIDEMSKADKEIDDHIVSSAQWIVNEYKAKQAGTWHS